MKYLGSKARIAKYIVPELEHIIDNTLVEKYIEPFVGGANIIDKIKWKGNLYGYDNDSIVIDLLRNYKDKKLNLPELPTKEHYYDVRDNPNKYDSTYRSAILLFASYNARVYGGCYGAFAKTKDGKIRNYFQEAKRNFEKQLKNIDGIIFENRDFFDLECKNALIYCDPPYKGTTKYKSNFDHNKFWKKVRELSKNNIVIVSEYSAPSDFYSIKEIKTKTHLNNRNKLDKIEKLFVLKDGCWVKGVNYFKAEI